MSRRKQFALAGCAFIAAAALIFWPQVRGPLYEGRTVEEWFKDYDALRNKDFYDELKGFPVIQRQPVSSTKLTNAESAFHQLGTNAVPYLANCINKKSGYSRMEIWRIKLRRHLLRWHLPPMLFRIVLRIVPHPRPREHAALTAAVILSDLVHPPGEMLITHIKPALLSTNSSQRWTAMIALDGVSSGYELARPYLMQGLKDADSQLQRCAAEAIRSYGEHGKWAVTNLLELASGPNFEVHESALHALCALGTNSWPIIPQLKKMLESEQDEKRRKVIAHSIDYIMGSGPAGVRYE